VTDVGFFLTPRLPSPLAPLLLALLAGGLALRAQRAVQAPVEVGTCAGDVVALLGLRVGEEVGGFAVVGVSCREPRAVSIELQGAPGVLSVQVVPRGARPHAPPARTERCELFYSHRGPAPAREAIQKALEAVALRVRAGEKAGLPAGW
jgi:hypothetical protein